MQTKIKYDWLNESMEDRETRLARDISQMVLFGSKVKDIKSKLKEIRTPTK
jgi:hypothetical protein